jgi:hypothetical protein
VEEGGFRARWLLTEAETPVSILQLLRNSFRKMWFLSEEKHRRYADWDNCFVIFERYMFVPHAEISNAYS